MQWEHAEDTSPPPILSPPTMICLDNEGAIKLADNLQFHNHTKHINIRYHFNAILSQWARSLYNSCLRQIWKQTSSPSHSLEISTRNALAQWDSTLLVRGRLLAMRIWMILLCLINFWFIFLVLRGKADQYVYFSLRLPFSHNLWFLVPEGLRRPLGIYFSVFILLFTRSTKTRAKVEVLVIRTCHVAFLMSL